MSRKPHFLWIIARVFTVCAVSMLNPVSSQAAPGDLNGEGGLPKSASAEGCELILAHPDTIRTEARALIAKALATRSSEAADSHSSLAELKGHLSLESLGERAIQLKALEGATVAQMQSGKGPEAEIVNEMIRLNDRVAQYQTTKSRLLSLNTYAQAAARIPFVGKRLRKMIQAPQSGESLLNELDQGIQEQIKHAKAKEGNMRASIKEARVLENEALRLKIYHEEFAQAVTDQLSLIPAGDSRQDALQEDLLPWLEILKQASSEISSVAVSAQLNFRVVADTIHDAVMKASTTRVVAMTALRAQMAAAQGVQIIRNLNTTSQSLSQAASVALERTAQSIREARGETHQLLMQPALAPNSLQNALGTIAKTIEEQKQDRATRLNELREISERNEALAQKGIDTLKAIANSEVRLALPAPGEN